MYGTEQIVIKSILVLVLTIIAWRVIRTTGQRSDALRRIGMVLFIVGAFVSVFWPRWLSYVANKVGVGRGTDLLLYLLIVAFLASLANQYRRSQVLERQLTKLARQIALSDSPMLTSSGTLNDAPHSPAGAQPNAPAAVAGAVSPCKHETDTPPAATSSLPGNGAQIGETRSEENEQ
ncbi:MAG: DUF2304 domain-containing protein [Buchananella hordeovulneris]|nr:DUF2304 domain-containing protein [Buchananella hordeovulneris]